MELVDTPNEEIMKNLKCSICGKSIIDLNWVECVINPYEVLCMRCFRAEYTENSTVLHENANNYRLKADLKSRDHKIRSMKGQLINARNERDILEKDIVKNKDNIKKLIDSAYESALKCDSATAIEIIRNLKEELLDE